MRSPATQAVAGRDPGDNDGAGASSLASVRGGPVTSSADDERLDELVHRADIDQLIRLVDDRTSARDWAGLRRARDRSRDATKTGRQLWPVATLAEYRLALLAPPGCAAETIESEGGLFTIGPLTEVIAQHHTWRDLAGVLTPGPRAAIVAHERVLRGEPIDKNSADELPPVLDMPFELAPWEPPYELATYTDNGIDTPSPRVFATGDPRPLERLTSVELVEDDTVDLAVRQLVETWTADSNGHAEVVAAIGTAADAVAALGVGYGSLVEIPLADAMAWLGWSGASGGAHGRRRGAALGRFGALWTLATLLGLTDDWPVPLDELGDLAGDLRWYWWDAGEPVTGWRLQLAVDDRHDGIAWAITARDDT